MLEKQFHEPPLWLQVWAWQQLNFLQDTCTLYFCENEDYFQRTMASNKNSRPKHLRRRYMCNVSVSLWITDQHQHKFRNRLHTTISNNINKSITRKTMQLVKILWSTGADVATQMKKHVRRHWWVKHDSSNNNGEEGDSVTISQLNLQHM